MQRCAEGYETPTPIQAQAIPYAARRPRPARHRPDRHRQDGSLRAAHPAASGRDNRAPPRHLPRPDPVADARTRLADRRELQDLWQEPQAVARRGLRRRLASASRSILRGGVDILVATPGRLVDLIERRALTLSKVEIFVLDEVDQMLDLGFIHAIRKITGMLPKEAPEPVLLGHHAEGDRRPAANLLTDPVRVESPRSPPRPSASTRASSMSIPPTRRSCLHDLLKTTT
jgi:ATP-dependent RNA helicase RhlE